MDAWDVHPAISVYRSRQNKQLYALLLQTGKKPSAPLAFRLTRSRSKGTGIGGFDFGFCANPAP